MSIKVQASRFAVLKDDDTTDWTPPKSKTTKSGADKQKNQPKKVNKVRQKEREEKKELQSLAFGLPKPNKAAGKKKNANKSMPEATNKEELEQFKEWKEKDQAV